MRCNTARRLISTADDLRPQPAAELAEHLHECADCARLRAELDIAWQLIRAHPETEPSATFRAGLRKRLTQEERSFGRPWPLKPVLGWQWMALAAGALVLAVLFTSDLVVYQPRIREVQLSKTDNYDDQFLDDLQRTLRDFELEYLPAYDSWPVSLLETPDRDPSESSPQDGTPKKGGNRHEGA